MRIALLSPIDACALETLRRRHEVLPVIDAGPVEIAAAVQEADVVVLRSGPRLDRTAIGQARRLALVIRAGSGTDNIDVGALAVRGIPLVNIPAPGARAVAEMAFALMLALARNVTTADRLVRAGRWTKHQLTGWGLCGKTLGIVGAGSIGTQVGRLGAAWGMEVVGCVARPTTESRARLAAAGMSQASYDEVLRRSDFVSLHVPLTAATRGLVDAAALARMRPGAYLVNLARGGVVDEHALRTALLQGRLAGAALDVHAQEGDGALSPLAELDNVILTPHIGAGTFDAQRQIGGRVIELIEELDAARRSPNDGARTLISAGSADSAA